MRCVTLIGMPGSGKTAVGTIVAARLGWGFIDTDKAIELRQGLPLQDVINAVGEEAFRRLEEDAVINLPVEERTVIATGGSVVYSEAAMGHLAAISTVVFLDAEMEAIRRHIASEAPRGIVGMPKGGLDGLYQERLPLYRQYADVTVNLTSETPEEAAEKVVAAAGLDTGAAWR
jgi:shikimate kinase